MPPTTAHPTLLFYIYGPCGAHVTSLITRLQPSDPAYRARLIGFFEPYYSRLPGYDKSKPACTPTALLATDWQHDELAGFGSYTNWQVDTSARDGGAPKMALDKAIEALREGMPERRVWFAGEHTSPFQGLGTVTGAYWSGEGAAQRVLRAFGYDDEEGEDEDWDVVDHPAEERERIKGQGSLQTGRAFSNRSAEVKA